MNEVQHDVDLSGLHTFHLQIKSKYLVNLTDTSHVSDFLQSKLPHFHPWFILGGGSNVLFAGDYPGLIIRPAIKGIERVEETSERIRVRVGAGEEWDQFVDWCVARNLGGVENLSGIPGTVGAGPVQNIGAYGTEIREIIHAVRAVRCVGTHPLILQAGDCKFGYRDSVFKHELHNQLIITHVDFNLQKHPGLNLRYLELSKRLDGIPDPGLQAVRDAVLAIRREKLPDPKETGNAGSFFKNPIINWGRVQALQTTYPDMPVHRVDNLSAKLSAAWLIDQCGWKGKRLGQAGIHSRQPLILVNHGGATGEELLQLAKKVQQSVREHFGLELEREVQVVGREMIQ